MPIYKVNDKTYNVPENKAQAFESKYPNATVRMTAGGKNYTIPLKTKKEFQTQYKDAAFAGPSEEYVAKQKAKEERARKQEELKGTKEKLNKEEITSRFKGMSPETLGQRLKNVFDSGQMDTYIRQDEEKKIDNQYTPKKVESENDVLENYINRFALTERGQNILAQTGKTQDEIQEEFREGVFNRYGQKIQNDINAYNKEKNTSDVNALSTSIAGQLKEKKKELSVYAPSDARAALMQSASYNRNTAGLRKDISTLESAERLVNDAQNIIAEAKDPSSNFFQGVYRGTRDNLSWESWTFGLADMADSGKLLEALKKTEEGKELTQAETSLVDASLLNMATHAYYDDQMGAGYKAGQVTAESLPFMLEFVANPISASGSTIAKRLLKYGMKKFGKQTMKRSAAKFGARLAGDVAAATGMAATTGLPRIAGGAQERIIQDYDYGRDAEGNLYAKSGDISLGEALGKSALSTIIENQSEMIFNAFRGAGDVLKKAGIVDLSLPKSGIINKISQSGAGRVLREIRNNPTIRKVAERTQFHGLPEEYMEEVYNNFASVAIGDMTVDEAIDLDRNIDTFIGLVPTSMAFGALGIAGLAKERLANSYRRRKAFGKMTQEQQAKYAELEQMATQPGNEDIKQFIKYTIADETLTQDEKKAEIEYLFELVKSNAIQDMAPEETQQDANYNAGAEAEDKNKVKTEFEDAENKLKQKGYDVNTGDIEADAQTDADVAAYANAQAKMDGMLDKTQADIDAKVDEVERVSRSNLSNNGQLIEATTATGEKVFVKSGDIMQLLDGSYSATGSIVVSKEDGTSEFVDGKTLTITNVMDGQQYVDNAVSQVRAALEQQAANEIEGTLNMNPGDVYGMQTENGVVPVTILGTDQAGNIITDIAGQQTVMQRGQLEAAVAEAKKPMSKQVEGGYMKRISEQDGIVSADVYDMAGNVVNTIEIPTQQYYAYPDYVAQAQTAVQTETQQETQPVQAETSVAPTQKDTETEQPQMQAGEQAVQAETQQQIATDKDGNILYDQMDVEDAAGDIYNNQGLTEDEADQFVNANINQSEKDVKAIENKAPKMGTNMSKYKQDKAEWQNKLDEAKRKAEFWNNVKEYRRQSKQQPTEAQIKDWLKNTEPMTGDEYAAMFLLSKRLTRDSYMRETGYGPEETKKMLGMFATPEKGGISIERAAELMQEQASGEGYNFFGDSQDARNAIINVLGQVRTRGDLFNYIKNSRERIAREQQRQEREYYDNMFMQEYGMSVDEYQAYEEQIYNEIKALPQDAYDEVMNEFADEMDNYYKTKEDGQRGIETTTETGGEVLQGEQPVDERGLGTTEGQTGSESAGEMEAAQERIEPVSTTAQEQIKQAESEVNTTPTDAQKEAGNYKKGHVRIDGYDITIEQPKGSVRSGVDENGNRWETTMNNTYGYIRGTESVDGDHIDVFLSDNPEQGNVYVVDQINQETGEFDELKVMYGFGSMEEAKAAYLSNYSDGWKIGPITEVSKDEFKKWINSSKRKTKPFAEYVSVKPIAGESGETVTPTEQNVSEDTIKPSEKTAENESAPSNKGSKVAKERINPSGNRLVTDERYEELKQRMKAKLSGQMNIGIDPEILTIGIEMAVYHIEKGARKFTDYARNMISDLGDDIRPYLKAFYNGARGLPEMSGFEMDSYDMVSSIDVANFDKNTVNAMQTAEIIAREQEVEVEVKSAIEDLKERFVSNVSDLLGKEKLNVPALRKIAKDIGLNADDILIQELTELAIINKAKDIVKNGGFNKETFKEIVKLYESQPTISMRSSGRVEKQQYSTPIPISYLADMFIVEGHPASVLEPSAGNGMMVFGIPSGMVHANDIDSNRLDNLRKQGFSEITSQDALLPFSGKYDAVVTNPPFGSLDAKDFGGYLISGLEKQMSINALDSMNDNGRAAIVIGGNTEYKENGSIKGAEKAYFNYLYNNYNVVDVINISGDLYAKQGTKYPVRLILINGRKTIGDERYAPVKSKARAEQITTFNELFNRVNNENILPIQESTISDGNRKQQPDSRRSDNEQVDRDGRQQYEARDKSNRRSAGSTTGEGLSDIKEKTSDAGERRAESMQGDNGVRMDADSVGKSERGKADRGRTGELAGNTAGRTDAAGVSEALGDVDRKPVEINIENEKTHYPAQSKSTEIGSVVPTNTVQAIEDVLGRFGDIDAYVQEKLGYESKEELFKALSAEQIDSVALAISQMENGQGFIIGDMTGVGKGRQAAALIRYAVNNGYKPIFMTEKANLFSDIYRDLRDIGSPELVPFIVNDKGDSDPSMTDEAGNVVYKVPSKSVKQKAYNDKELPEGYDYVVITYSQLSTSDKKTNPKKDFFGEIAKENILIMDESHNAGGTGNTGLFLQKVLPTTTGVTFLSGTFAKRADNMPIYAIKTNMSDANMSQEDLINAIMTGGVPLQEIMSRNLVESGQMIRRERDYTGVTIDWLQMEGDTEKQKTAFNKIIEIFNDLIRFQRDYIDPIIDGISEDLAEIQGDAGNTKGTKDLGISNTPFASKTFNLVRQLLFALKADYVADRAIMYAGEGLKPVIAVSNTMEGFIKDEMVADEDVENPDFSITLRKGLDGLFRYTEKKGSGISETKLIPLSDLSKDGQKRYYELLDKINDASSGLSISPIDVIKNKVQRAGYSIGELTGREFELRYNDDGTVRKVKRGDKDKKKLMRDFNNGELDMLILNQSASTGISLHASTKFKDQRQRVMIFAQNQLDVNTEVQMRGRTDRTGQVHRSKYEYIVSPIPAEGRLMMMFKSKLKSLDANTTSSQKSKINEMQIVDFLNKYGDQVVVDYLKENIELVDKLLDPLHMEDMKEEEIEKMKASGGEATKVAGRVALLNVDEQEQFYKDIAERYNTLINYLNETGTNDLEITILPLNAKTISKEVIVPGKDPDGENAFADNSYLEQVEVDVLKKPMTAKEVKENIKKFTEGRSATQYRDFLIGKVDEYEASQLEKVGSEYSDVTVPKMNELIQKERERILKNKKLNEEKKAELVAKKTDDITAKYQGQLERKENSVRYKMQIFRQVFSNLPVGKTLLIPNSLSSEGQDTGLSYGMLIGYKMSEKMSPSTTTAVFATLDGRRKMEIPLSRAEFIQSIISSTLMNIGEANSITLDNWDEKIPNKTRKNSYIITGNVLQAYGTTSGGQLVTYSTDNGEFKQGILLPDSFKKTDIKRREPISIKYNDILNGEAVTDSTKEVTFSKAYGTIYVYVPQSKRAGGKYYLDKNMQKFVVGGSFVQRGNKFQAEVPEANLKKMLDYMSKTFGTSVSVQALGNDKKETGTRFRSMSGQMFASEDTTAISEAATALADKFNTPIRIANSLDDLSEAERQAVEEQHSQGRRVAGFYNPATDEVVVFMPDVKDIQDVKATVFHEIVGHKGLRELYGQEFNDFLLDVYTNADSEVRAEIAKRIAANNWDAALATEEYLAELAERGTDINFWDRIANLFRNFLRKIGLNVGVSVRELRYILRQSYNNRVNGGVFRDAQRVSDEYLMNTGRFSDMSAEEQDIIDHAKADGTYMLAPNGQPTNLTEKQWAQVRTQAFKDWFGDWENDPANASKVVDENGEPKVVYRGTPEQMGNVFVYGKNFYGGNKGFWFTTSKDAARSYSFNEETGEYGETKSVFLKADNLLDLVPLKFNTTSKSFADYVDKRFDIYIGRGSNKVFRTNELYEKYQNELYPGEHDGIVLADVGLTYIVKTPSQIKSATDNIGTFSAENEDIRYMSEYNPGYSQRDNGTNASVRAIKAETEGSYSAGNFKKKYGVSKKDFDVLSDLNAIVQNEWHHTGVNFRKTDFYSWADSSRAGGKVNYTDAVPEGSMADRYKKNKKEISKLSNEYENLDWEYRDMEKIPSLEMFAEEVAQLTEEEKQARDKEHKEISDKSDVLTPYERREEHYAVDVKYRNIERNRAEKLLTENRDELVKQYNEKYKKQRQQNTETEKYNSESQGKESVLIKIGQLLGLDEKNLKAQVNIRSQMRRREAEISRLDEVYEQKRVEVEQEIENFVDGLVKDNKAVVRTRIKERPEMFIEQNREMKGRYGWFKSSGSYKLPEYYSGIEFLNKEDYDKYLSLKRKQRKIEDDKLRNINSNIRFRAVPTTPQSVAQEYYNEGILGTTEPKYIKIFNKELLTPSLARTMANLEESWFDYMRSVRVLQEAIEKETGEKIKDSENVYLRENANSSVNKIELEMLEREKVQPLMETLRDISDEELDGEYITQRDIEQYLNSVHGLERNEKMYNDNLNDPNYKGEARRDYSGLTAIYETDDVEAAEDEARKYIQKFEDAIGKDLADELWKNIKAITDYSVEKEYKSGLISKEVYDKIKGMYNNYVPLRGFDDDTAGDVYNYFMHNDYVLQSVVKTAKGRRSRAADIIGNILNMMQSSVIRSNKNSVKQCLLNLAISKPTKLLTVGKQWYEKSQSGDIVPVLPPVTDSMTEDERREAIEKFEEDMQQKAKNKEVFLKNASFDAGLRTDKYQKMEHTVKVYRNGREFVVYVNASPRAAQAINGLLNEDNRKGTFRRFAGASNRWLASVFTSYNPEFIYTNLIRDIQSANMTTLAVEGWSYTKRFNKNLKDNISLVAIRGAKKGRYTGIFSLYRKFKKGTLDLTNERERYFDEFLKNGGETGYTQMLSIDDYNKIIRKEMTGRKNYGKVIMEGIEFINRGVENSCRFAAYMTSRQAGRSITESIRDAKEVSVNFNRKGSGAMWNKYMRDLYIFLNASLQGTFKLAKLMKKYPKSMKGILLSTITIGFLNGVINGIIGADGDDGDDNDFYSLTPYTRRNNFIAGANGKYFSLPLPHEIKAFYGVGQIAAGYIQGYDKYEDTASAIVTQLSTLMPIDFVNADGLVKYDDSFIDGVIRGFTPTTIGYIADVYWWNKDYTGRPITNQQDWNRKAPEYLRASNSTPAFYTSISKWLNMALGGEEFRRSKYESKYLNPSAIVYFINTAFGGPATIVNKSIKTFEMIFGDEDFNVYNVPILNKMVKFSNDDYARTRNVMAGYWYYMSEYDLIDYEISQLKKSDDVLYVEERVAEMEENGDMRKWEILKGAKSEISKVNNAIKATNDKDELKELYNIKTGIMQEAIEQIEDRSLTNKSVEP